MVPIVDIIQHFFYAFRRWLFNGFRRGRNRFLMVSVVGFVVMVSILAGNVFLWFPSLDFFNGVRGILFDGFCLMVSVVARKHFVMVSVVGCLMVSVVAGNICLYGFRRWFLFMVSG